MRTKQITPFSNGSEADHWYYHNCEQCTKAYFPKNGEYPSGATMKNYVSIGRECALKYNLDEGFICGTINVDTAKQIGTVTPITDTDNFCRLKSRCDKFSSDDNDKFKWPKKPKPEPPNQMVMPFIITELGIEINEPSNLYLRWLEIRK